MGTTGIDLIGELTYTMKEINNFTVGIDVTADWHKLQTYYSHYFQQVGSFTRTIIEPTDYDILGTKLFHNVGTYFQSVLYPFALFGVRKMETLGLTLNIRYDHHGVYGEAVNYRLGGVFFKEKLLSAKILRLLRFDTALRLEQWLARGRTLNRFGVNQMYVARLK